tara:strand:+ start:138 stop:722 length:585 start_codon:yes stop_codon:yes gene_type:complete
MAESYLDTLKKAIDTNNISSKARSAGNWFRSVVNRARGKFSSETPSGILAKHEAAANQVLGKMYFFTYDPKWKKELPWYDTFPLVFPIKTYSNGFLGLNFHYLNPKERAILMDQLKSFASNKRFDESTKLLLTYQTIKSMGRARPTIHRYLGSHVQSKFVLINSDEWEVALFLPVERFKKASKKQVWAHSGGMY